MNREIEIVIASPDDASALGRMQTSTWRTNYPNLELGVTAAAIEVKLSELNADGDERLCELLREPSHRTWVAKDGQTIVGFVGVRRSKDINVIEALHVVRKQQGTGIGNLLLGCAIEWLGNAKPVVLDVVAYNNRAIHFYESHGFRQQPSTTEHVIRLTGGVNIPLVRMVKA